MHAMLSDADVLGHHEQNESENHDFLKEQNAIITPYNLKQKGPKNAENKRNKKAQKLKRRKEKKRKERKKEILEEKKKEKKIDRKEEREIQLCILQSSLYFELGVRNVICDNC